MSPAAPDTIASLIAVPKTVHRPFRALSQDPENARLDLELAAATPGRFFVFIRVLRALSENFSIGLRYEEPGLGVLVLLRVNGDHGRHQNPGGSVIPDGPHIHTFRSPARDAPPRPRAEAKWAWPLPADHLALPTAWRTFCGLVSLDSTTKIDKKVGALYASLIQLPLGSIR